jgi:hypothetical protein
MQCATTTGSGMASFLGAFTAEGAASIDVSSLATAGCACLTSGSLTMTLGGGDVVVLVPGPGMLRPTRRGHRGDYVLSVPPVLSGYFRLARLLSKA